MIGNDLVDLNLARSQSNWRRKGFLEKVFSIPERELISTASEADVMVWLLWSMKEAAYKAHQRRFGLPRKLNWKDQQCELRKISDKEASGLIKIDNEFYFSTSEITSEAIFTSVIPDTFSRLINRSYKQPSEVMKKHFFRNVSEHYGLTKKKLELRKDRYGIPLLMYDQRIFPCSFSFTAHGQYSAFSLELMNC